MDYYKEISANDKIAILTMNGYSEKLKVEYMELIQKINRFYDFKHELDQTEKPHYSLKLKRNAWQKEIDEEYKSVNKKINDWNDEFMVIAKKNNFLKLGDFLVGVSYLKDWEKRPSKEIAKGVYQESKHQNIYKLFLLNPDNETIRGTTLYPFDWLKLNFKSIYDGQIKRK